MGQRGSEKGIKDDVDYGTKFLDARKGAGGGDEPPPPPPVPAPLPPSGKSVGQILLFAVLSLTVIAGGVGLFVLTGGGGGGGDDLISEGGDVDIADRERRVTTTTTRPTTTTERTTTTSTTAPPATVTTVQGVTTVPNGGTVVPVVTTAAPACPGGGVSSAVGGTWTSIVGGNWKVDFTGSSTTNNTNAGIKLNVEVPITYVDSGGSSRVIVFRPDQYGQTVAPGQTVNWSGQKLLESSQQPVLGSATGQWAWVDPAFASCEVGTFS